jgi:hypothetical protein
MDNTFWGLLAGCTHPTQERQVAIKIHYRQYFFTQNIILRYYSPEYGYQKLTPASFCFNQASVLLTREQIKLQNYRLQIPSWLAF